MNEMIRGLIMIKGIFFDLFFTLVYPSYEEDANEYTVLNIPVSEWENYAENSVLYRERALGYVHSEIEIINKITSIIPFPVSEKQKRDLLKFRIKRMHDALENVPDEIYDTLEKLKNRNIKIGLISNADIIDCKYWEASKLSSYFDDAVLSCYVNLLKPDIKIYELAMKRLDLVPEECIFAGDGGSEELFGAKMAHMKTVYAEHLISKSNTAQKEIMNFSDFHITQFSELLDFI